MAGDRGAPLPGRREATKQGRLVEQEVGNPATKTQKPAAKKVVAKKRKQAAKKKN